MTLCPLGTIPLSLIPSPNLIPCVSFVSVPGIVSRSAKKRLQHKANKRLQRSSADNLSDALTVLPSASSSISILPTDNASNRMLPLTTHALSAVTLPTAPCLASASELSSASHVNHAPLYSLYFPPAVLSSDVFTHMYFDNLVLTPSPYDTDADFARIVTPYCPDAFHAFLQDAHVLHRFPELSFKLRHGFALGKFTPITTTYIPDNLPGAYQYHSVIAEYIREELVVGHFSGPFSREELKAKIGPFCSSPLQVTVKKGIDGAPDKFRICHHLSYRGSMGFSINDEINAGDYPTEWGMAEQYAEIVCSHYLSMTNAFATSRGNLPTHAGWNAHPDIAPSSFL